MKKAIVLLLALAVIGGAVFAEDAAPVLTFGTYMDATATLVDQDSNTGFGLYHEFYFNYAAKDMGFSATTTGDAGDFFGAVRNYAFSYKMLESKVTLYAGKLRETGDVRFTSYIDGNGFSSRLGNVHNGVLVKAKPIDGLVISAFVPFNAGPVGTDFALSNFGAAYTITDIAKIAVSYRLENSEFAIGADVKAVADTTIRAGFKMIVDGDNYIYLTAGKVIAGIDLGLDADIVLGDAVGFGAKIKAQYDMAPFAFGLKATYDNGDAWYGNDGITVNPYALMNFAAGDIIVGFNYNTGDSTWSIPIDFEVWF